MQKIGHHQGFTLIELSIVLVIIGLIVGGVLVGQDLIKAAQLRAIMTEYEKFQTAVNTFRGKYDCLPGDCANATLFFGGPDPNCGVGNTLTTTCNGNGDGNINYGYAANGVSMYHDESHLFWQHLGFARMIPGNYTGSGNSGQWLPTTPGINVPASAFPSACWDIQYSGDQSTVVQDDAQIAPPPMNTFLWGNNTQGGNNTNCFGGLLTASQMQTLDTKYDDGMPVSGRIQAIITNGSFSPPCITAWGAGEPASYYHYLTNYAQPNCMIFLEASF